MTTPIHADPIQNEIEEKGLNAPRVRPEDLEAEIAAETYFTADEGARGAYITHDDQHQTRWHGEYTAIQASLQCLTFCVLVLRNGITVTGQSACVSAANFDAEIGRKVARQDALRQLWPLLGFRLADRIAKDENPLFRAP